MRWIFSYILESRTISTGGIEEERLMVTWDTDGLGLTPWSELGRSKSWVSVTESEVFDYFCAIGSAGMWWGYKDWSHHSVRNFFPNPAKSVAGTYIGKFQIWQTGIFKWKKKILSKATWLATLLSSDLGRWINFSKVLKKLLIKFFSQVYS